MKEIRKFSEVKNEFDSKYGNESVLSAFLPVNLNFNKEVSIKGKNGQKNEEYYKWQLLYSLVYSGMYPKENIGTEISFPKGNKNSAPIRFDAAIFDDSIWFEKYTDWQEKGSQSDLDWLRKHLIGVIEIKNEESKNVEVVFNQQLKAAMKESEADFVLGILYDAERLYLFKKRKESYIRLDESLNAKGEQSGIKDLTLHIPDAYITIPTFSKLFNRIHSVKIDRSKRTVYDLEPISGVYSKQLTDGISNILRTMDKVGMKNTRGYEIFIHILALKIFDEKRNEELNRNSIKEYYLDFYKLEEERQKLDGLSFYIDAKEKSFYSLDDDNIQTFIKRIKKLYIDASAEYQHILNRTITETINWNNIEHIRIISEIVEQLQDYSFLKSEKTDLYQLVFYKFASEFSKTDKGQFVTPIRLIEFLVKIVNPRGKETVIDPTAGIADFLSVAYVNSKKGLKDSNLYGLDNDPQMVRLAQLNMILNGAGNAKLEFKPDKGSIVWKFDNRNNLVQLNPKIHKNGEWDNGNSETKLKKFDVVLTNPPFGEDRKIEPKDETEKSIMEMYQLWNEARSGNWIDPGLVFLENAYRILDENGRMGIILSNSIASVDRWNKAREWLMKNMRIVAIFDLPSDVFADTGVNTTIIVAYKPKKEELEKLKEQNYEIFSKDIENVGYEIRTSKRVKYFNPIYKINTKDYEIEVDEDGNPMIEEDFSQTIKDFKNWCLGQEKELKDAFLD